MMRSLASHGYSHHFHGFKPSPAFVGRVAESLREQASTGNGCSAVRNVRLTIEAHEGQTGFSRDTLPVLRMLRASLGRCCCVLLTARFREPLAHYESAWRWTGAPLFARFGKTFFDWAPRNLQSMLLLHVDYQRWVAGRKREGKKQVPGEDGVKIA